MENTTKNVAVIYGGMGAESEISVLSAEFILSEINREIFSVLPVFIDKSGFWMIKEPKSEEEGLVCCPTKTKCGSGLMTEAGFIPLYAAFPVLHGDYGEDGIIQGALDAFGIPFVGCKTRTGALCADKALTKALVEKEGIKTVPWVLAYGEATDENITKARKSAEVLFGYPMFIKPSGGGSSIGISRVEKSEDFTEAYLSASIYDKRIIVEKAIDVKCELECAIFADGKQIFTKIGAVSTNGEFYDFDKKYKDGISATPFAPITPDMEKVVTDSAKTIAELLEVRQLSRIDFFLTDGGEIIFNEINTLPGFTKSSLYPRLTERCGIAPSELITRLVLGAAL